MAERYSFSRADASLGLLHGSMGETALATESTGKAYELLDRASDREKFFITAYYIYPVPGGFEKAAEEARKNIELAPDNGVGYFNLGYDSVYLDRLGEAENAARADSKRKIVTAGKAIWHSRRPSSWPLASDRYMPGQRPDGQKSSLPLRIFLERQPLPAACSFVAFQK